MSERQDERPSGWTVTPQAVAKAIRESGIIRADQIHTELPTATLDDTWAMWDCPECGTRVATKYVPPPIDADHPDCGDRCACYQRGVHDEWEATRD